MTFLNLEHAAHFLRAGDLVAFPTETVYGLGASIFQPEAIKKIFAVKGRPSDNPLIVHISNFNQLSDIVLEPPQEFFLLANSFFPGPLTILLKKKDSVSSLVSANLPTIGIRMPAHPLALALIEAVGVPLVAPSANLSGKPSSTTAQHVLDDFGSTIAGVLDGGPCSVGIESTVITLDPVPTILRPGSISAAELEHVLQKPFIYASEKSDRPLSPGLKYRHYAPKAQVMLFYDESSFNGHLKSAPHKKRMCLKSIRAEGLYAYFREADKAGCEEIVILCGSKIQENRALMNRLTRAAQ